MSPQAAQVQAVPFVPWGEFLPAFVQAWKQGEHVTVIGPTGQGKTYLCIQLLQARASLRGSHIVALGTKPKDPTLRALGWPVIRTWPPGYGKDQVIFWPPYGDVRTAAQRQRAAFVPMLAAVFKEGARVVYFDEVQYLEEDLRMEAIVRRFYQQGRSNDITIVGGTQRPRRVSRSMFSECSWFVAFRTADEDELRRVSEIGGADTRAIREAIRHLAPHEFLVVETRTGVMVRSKVTR